MAVEIKLSDGTALVYDDPDGMGGIRAKLDEGYKGQFIPIDDRESGEAYIVNPRQVVSLRYVA